MPGLDVLDVPIADVPIADVPGLDVLDVPIADVPIADVPIADVSIADVLGTDIPVIDATGTDASDSGRAADASDVPPMCPTRAQVYCFDGCVDTETSASHCGRCGNRCAFANAAASCAAGTCLLGACMRGFDNCDGNAANGCETNLLTDINNCGACDTLCRNYVNGGTSECAASVCVPTCNAGYDNCDGNAANGCEVSLNSNLNCGRCGRPCTTNCGTGGTCTGVAPGSYLQTSYRFPGPSFIDACAVLGHTTHLPNLDDDSVRIPLPFAMRSWNAIVPINTQINITSNGWLSFDGVALLNYFGMIPDTAAPNWLVAPYFTDLFTSATGVCVATIGVSPSRRFIVEWADAVFLSDRTRHVTFEAILNESGLIEFYYDTMAPPPTPQNVTIGLENQTGAAGVVVCNPANPCTIGTGARLGYMVQ